MRGRNAREECAGRMHCETCLPDANVRVDFEADATQDGEQVERAAGWDDGLGRWVGTMGWTMGWTDQVRLIRLDDGLDDGLDPLGWTMGWSMGWTMGWTNQVGLIRLDDGLDDGAREAERQGQRCMGSAHARSAHARSAHARSAHARVARQ